ncbi:hypothetical protein I7I50_11815 [Histoplasma capsulatum G186AR]|uniref:Uncharacterized protein n=1 Tax=Ajellomyces capsulatus TaxID=5037 RepID=A0A8H7ZBD2_AJECA|nr:hypothetical protein I7I52_03053 [Histoplasma capsulatum]QSS70248.1 hypothetical protein I7I50_11815 [Histoplasma capsulatum G186AR]
MFISLHFGRVLDRRRVTIESRALNQGSGCQPTLESEQMPTLINHGITPADDGGAFLFLFSFLFLFFSFLFFSFFFFNFDSI